MSTPTESFSPLPRHAPEDVHELLLWAIEDCARRVSESSGIQAEALILTGSMARGEASVLRTDKGITCLSDMEFLIAVQDRGHWKQRADLTRVLTQQVTEEAAARRLECDFEFTLAPRNYFRTVRHSIFAYELHRHGRTVWGDPSFMRIMSTFPASSISNTDALNLVCNRMIEQLAWRSRICDGDCCEADRLFAYSLVKTYVDLGTSLLIFAGQYESTYAQRAKRLDSLRDSVAAEIADFDLLLDKIAANSLLKLQPTQELLDPMRKEEALNRWTELARFVLRVWQWEVQQLANGTSGDEATQIVHFARNCSRWERFRDWTKLARSAAVHGNVSDLLRASYLSGSPRNRLYVEAMVRYVKLAGLEGEFPFAKTNTKSFLPIRSRAIHSSEENVAEIIRIWNTYFRNT